MRFLPESFQLSTPTDREILVERDFDAPRALVFDAFTKPELVRRWLLGPEGWTMPVCEIDLRVGGSYRYQWLKESTGHRMGMGGVFREVVRPERIVATEKFDNSWYPGEALNTTVFEEAAGITKVRLTVLYESKEARDAASRSGMERGMIAGYDRLEQMLAPDVVRHMLATLAYRGGKAIRNAPVGFGTFRAEGALNTPAMLLAHVGDLIEWAHRWTRGDQTYSISPPLEWDGEVQRFHRVLGEFDAYLASGAPRAASVEELFQVPIADALTHIGQLSLLRRLAGDPVLGEAYRMAEIVPGRVGPDQAKPGQEFKRDKGAIWRPKPKE